MPQRFWLIVLIIVIVIAIGAVWGVYFWQKHNILPKSDNYTREQNQNDNLPEVNDNTNQPTDQVADWQVYTNDQYGFSFKYPADYEVIKNNNIIFIESKVNKPSGHGNIITISDKPIEQLIKELRDSLPLMKNYKEQKILVNGQEALKINYDPVEGDLPEDNLGVYIRSGQKTYAITRGFGYPEVFEQIIKNFKFDTNNLFNLDDIKVGDKIAGMIIKLIGKFSDKVTPPLSENPPLSEENVSINFSGQATITGDYNYQLVSDMGGIEELCFSNLSEDSENLIPKLYSFRDYRVRFCITNIALAKDQLNLKTDGKGRATIEISDYELNSYPSEVFNRAKFVGLIGKK